LEAALHINFLYAAKRLFLLFLAPLQVDGGILRMQLYPLIEILEDLRTKKPKGSPLFLFIFI
jgi:hypothetical protein